MNHISVHNIFYLITIKFLHTYTCCTKSGECIIKMLTCIDMISTNYRGKLTLDTLLEIYVFSRFYDDEHLIDLIN